MAHVVVVGSGIAGLTAALLAAEHGPVTLVTKSGLNQSNTWFAQGGVAAVTSPDDAVEDHIADTLGAGAGLCDPEAVRALCATGPEVIAGLIDRGVRFDFAGAALSLGLEAAHSRPRILHAGGDATGAGMAGPLIDRVLEGDIDVRAEAMVTDLIVDGGRVSGVRLRDGAPQAGGAPTEILADAVILATGGAGQLYPYTTNPAVATGDGVAVALRAGAVVADLEFYQFHPTAVADGFLISEAVRGEGAVLLDDEDKRFMFDVHPDGELAPRDVVARGIVERTAAQAGVPIRLDATFLGAEFLAARFPTIDAGLRARGFDWASEPVPVTPAAHYWMGGVRTDVWGRTSIPGLYAVGEVACTGVHGANRLASNSLLEGAVYAARCVEAIRTDPPAEHRGADWPEPTEIPAETGDQPVSRADLQALMWKYAGLARDAEGLTEALTTINRWSAPDPIGVRAVEDANLLTVARAVLFAASRRTESRGGHFRSDFPVADTAARHASYVSKAQ